MKTAVLIDSTTWLPEEIQNRPDLYEVYLTANFENGDSIKDTDNLEEIEAFYDRLSHEKKLPTSSQPTPGDYYEVMDQILEEGYEAVLAIHLSSGASGTFQTAEVVLGEYADRIKIALVNTWSVSVVAQEIITRAFEMLDRGFALDDIVDKLRWLADNSTLYLMVENLQTLVTGGRLSASGALIGSMLRVRPIITFNEEGSLKVFERIRTNRRVYARWAELYEEALEKYPQGVHVGLAHAFDEEGALEALAALQKRVPGTEPCTISYLSLTLGVHVGKGCKAIGFVPKLDYEVE